LLVTVLGCADDAEAPSAPGGLAPVDETAAAALAYWQVSSGNLHACGITSDDRAYCWGYNGFGQLGSGTNDASLTPVPVAGTRRFRQIDASDYGACALTTDDRAFCWGAAFYPVRTTSPQAVGGSLRFRQVSASGEHVCAVRRDDSRAYCWGTNSFGQLGDGTTTDRLTPTPVAGNRRFRQLAGGERHTCGVTTTDEIFCWGSNQWGQLGDGSSRTVDHLRPTRVAGTRRYESLTAGRFHTCAVTGTAKAFCWGRQGAIGDGANVMRTTPRAVTGGLSFRRLTGGHNHTCGETTGNRAYCWGANFYGGLGDGTAGPVPVDYSLVPVAVAGGLQWRQLSAGSQFTCGKTTADVAYCWGYNGVGQLGDGTLENRNAPVRVADPT
jgi:alpha-tubulin suppressor-like RCC1 family protein